MLKRNTLKQGIILKSTGSNYSVQLETGEQVNCKLKGNMRMKEIRTTNPVTVGDRVLISFNDGADNGFVEEVLERKNCIIRKATNLSKESHLIASNIDQTFLIVSMKFPHVPFGFIDRYLVTAESFQIPVIIVFNKVDIYDDKALELYADYRYIYENLGYQCIDVSATTGYNMSKINALLEGKVSLFSGQSGVGKSTVLNYIIPELDLKTDDVSGYNEKGKHTTTFAEMFPLTKNTYVIDTPGIKDFGLIVFDSKELALYFREMKELLDQCKFYNCTHIHEPGCAVKRAFDKGEIAASRYQNYVHMFNDLKDEKEY